MKMLKVQVVDGKVVVLALQMEEVVLMQEQVLMMEVEVLMCSERVSKLVEREELYILCTMVEENLK